jgi:hypothetical protein
MRLIEWGQQEAYQPLQRGEALPQYYETGDRFTWEHAMMWHYRFWNHVLCEVNGRPDEYSMMLMGGEL